MRTGRSAGTGSREAESGSREAESGSGAAGSRSRTAAIGRRRLHRQAALLLTVLMLDGAILGLSMGVMNRSACAGAAEATPQVEMNARWGVETLVGAEPSVGAEALVEADVQAEADARPEIWRLADTSGSRESAMDASTESDYRVVALTFDDGPHKSCTPALLDGLKSREVPATFFLMGENIAGNEDLVRRMKEEGHLIGNHSFRHIQLTKAGEDAVCQAVEETEELIESLTGERPKYLRPPYGDWNEQLECRTELTTVFWSLDSLDWKLKSVDRIVRRVEKGVKNGDIILMHDIFPTSVEAALQIVDDLTAQGYHFVTVDELLID